MTPEDRRTLLKRLLRQRPSPRGTRQPVLGTGPLWAASPRRVLSHGEAARRAVGRRADGHVASATTTTAGVRRRPGAAGPVPAPGPGFPAACGWDLRARARARTLARTTGARSLHAPLGTPRPRFLLLGRANREAPVIVAEGRERWFCKLGALSPVSIPSRPLLLLLKNELRS